MKVCTRGDRAPLHRLAAAAHVVLVGAREPAHGAVLDDARHRPHRLEIAVARGRESRLDHVDAHALELARDAQLLLLASSTAPGLCSPSRIVVSNMISFSFAMTLSVLSCAAGGAAPRTRNRMDLPPGGFRRARTQLQTASVGSIMRRGAQQQAGQQEAGR